MGMEDRNRLLAAAEGMVLTPAERALIYEQIESAKVNLRALEGVVAVGALPNVIRKHGQIHQCIDYIGEVMSECMRRNVLAQWEEG